MKLTIDYECFLEDEFIPHSIYIFVFDDSHCSFKRALKLFLSAFHVIIIHILFNFMQQLAMFHFHQVMNTPSIKFYSKKNDFNDALMYKYNAMHESMNYVMQESMLMYEEFSYNIIIYINANYSNHAC